MVLSAIRSDEGLLRILLVQFRYIQVHQLLPIDAISLRCVLDLDSVHFGGSACKRARRLRESSVNVLSAVSKLVGLFVVEGNVLLQRL